MRIRPRDAVTRCGGRGQDAVTSGPSVGGGAIGGRHVRVGFWREGDIRFRAEATRRDFGGCSTSMSGSRKHPN